MFNSSFSRGDRGFEFEMILITGENPKIVDLICCRMMPLYMMILAFFVLVFPYIDDGPLWKTIVWREVERCQENWWTNLLVINNYVNTEKMVPFLA